ncbi:AraC family transcriptional regulator [Pseudanabaena sp. FACHB-2040]|uniref:helix-turn-helix transcriptional regulator n=1 Tax=Pseudanabaena sp. FACHB-2040 TaxID=2692859 RepID=UPI001686B3D4|nr:AraC family transcriptional regulator [Pseudanabaena sp. FACHB-2040]MBD2258237.1 helix-turn-helix transcriptional regulator [Pseudanabaena sp. FACHB-2040]
MTITLSQTDYWDLFECVEPIQAAVQTENFEEFVVPYPSSLGQGLQRSISLRAGLELMISEYELLEDVRVRLPERPHPLEYTFEAVAGSGRCANQRYGLWGAGLAPQEDWLCRAGSSLTAVNVHIEPELFQAWVGGAAGDVPTTLQPLLRAPDRQYYERWGQPTASMQGVLQQLMACPYQGLTRRLYLESKVWELMALLLEDMQTEAAPRRKTHRLHAEDVERIHCAGKILVRRLDDPPSLMELARAVGINDHKLKVGFRQVFGTTAFGYLHERRLERSQQLLAAGEISVTEAAQVVGFASRGHFAAAFRRKFGVNPSVYIRQQG